MFFDILFLSRHCCKYRFCASLDCVVFGVVMQVLFVILSFVLVFALACLKVFVFYEPFGFERKGFFKEAWAEVKKSIGFYAICLVCFILLFTLEGCSKPTYKVQVKEVLIPIQCNLELPNKPKEDGSFSSHKALAVYYKEVEQIAKDCVGFQE